MMQLFSFIYRHLHRHGFKRTLTAYDLMAKALEISANNVIIYDIPHQHVIKVSGHMLPDGGISVEGFKEHVHPDDLDLVVNSILDIRAGKVQSLEFDYRWNFDYSGGEPRWRWLHNTSVAENIDGVAQPVSIISTLIDETKLHEQQEEEETLSQRYKQIFEHSIIGLSFYSPDGWLLDANAQMRAICHFDSDEEDAFFSNTNLFDLFPFNEVLDRNNITAYWGC